MTTLKDFVPLEGHMDAEALLERHGDKKVVKRFDGTEVAFPQLDWRYRYVHHWVLLEDGSAVGWNESPRSGWSFPRIGKRGVERFRERARDPGF